MHVHVCPQNDEQLHILDFDCDCQPHVEWLDPDTGKPWPAGGARVVHFAFDHREAVEELLGENLAPDKRWELWEVD